MQVGTVQLLAVLLTVVNATVLVLLHRWERPGRSARLRASVRPPPLAVRAGYAALLLPLISPVVVLVAPGWGYDGPLNWSSRLDAVLQTLGLALWAGGTAVVLQAGRAMGGYMGVDGVTEDHRLVASGPYRYVRHPMYGAFTAVATGLGLVFRSSLLLGVAVLWLAAGSWWVNEEETVLASREGLGDDYRNYCDRTGRFLPKLTLARRRPR